MFPRIVKSKKKSGTYEYLVISESVHIKGKGSTTRNIANLGNIERNKKTQKACGYGLNQKVIDYEEKMDGIFILTTSRQDLETKKYRSLRNGDEITSPTMHHSLSG